MNENGCLTTLPFDDQWMDGMCQIFRWTNRSLLQLTHYTLLNLVHNDAFDINSNTVLPKNLQHICCRLTTPCIGVARALGLQWWTENKTL